MNNYTISDKLLTMVKKDNNLSNEIFCYNKKILFSLFFIEKYINVIDYNFTSDIAIVPYIISDYGILEIYDYSMNMLITGKIHSLEEIVYRVTDGININKLSNEAISIIKNTNYEILLSDKKRSIDNILQYIQFMKKIEMEMLSCKLLDRRGRFYDEFRE